MDTSIDQKDPLHAQSKLRCGEADIAQLQVVLDEERDVKCFLIDDLAVAISEAALQKDKLDTEYFLKIMEVEHAFYKLH